MSAQALLTARRVGAALSRLEVELLAFQRRDAPPVLHPAVQPDEWAGEAPADAAELDKTLAEQEASNLDMAEKCRSMLRQLREPSN